MGRAKLSLMPITRERYRNTTYQKRKAGLFKKAKEFSVLCDVDACVIVYGPQPKRHGNVRVKADTYPPDINKVQRIIRRSAGNCRGKHTQDLSDFFQTRKQKMEREIAKQRAKNWRIEYSAWDVRLDGLPENQLRHFVAVLEAKLEAAARVKLMRAGAKEVSHFNDMIDVGGYENYLFQNNYFSGGAADIPFPDYIDGGLLARAMGKRQEMDIDEEQERTPCPVPMIAMKMKTIQYMPCHGQDLDPQSSMLMLMNNINIGGDGGGFDGVDSSSIGSNNSFQYYASQMGVYNKYCSPLPGGGDGGGDSTVASSSIGNSFQYCAPLVLGGGGAAESAASFTGQSYQYGSSNGSNFQYYTALLGGGGDGVSSDDNNLQQYYTVGSSNGLEY